MSVSVSVCVCVIGCGFFQRSSSAGQSLWEWWLWSPPPLPPLHNPPHNPHHHHNCHFFNTPPPIVSLQQKLKTFPYKYICNRNFIYKKNNNGKAATICTMIVGFSVTTHTCLWTCKFVGKN